MSFDDFRIEAKLPEASAIHDFCKLKLVSGGHSRELPNYNVVPVFLDRGTLQPVTNSQTCNSGTLSHGQTCPLYRAQFAASRIERSAYSRAVMVSR